MILEDNMKFISYTLMISCIITSVFAGLEKTTIDKDFVTGLTVGVVHGLMNKLSKYDRHTEIATYFASHAIENKLIKPKDYERMKGGHSIGQFIAESFTIRNGKFSVSPRINLTLIQWWLGVYENNQSQKMKLDIQIT